jgi:hypothetical protein
MNTTVNGNQPGQRLDDLMELFQAIVIDGVSKRVSFKPRADDRPIAAEMTVAR